MGRNKKTSFKDNHWYLLCADRLPDIFQNTLPISLTHLILPTAFSINITSTCTDENPEGEIKLIVQVQTARNGEPEF